MTDPTEKEIDEQFEAAKKICKVLLPLDYKARWRILRYFADAVADNADLEREKQILKDVSKSLGIAKL